MPVLNNTSPTSRTSQNLESNGHALGNLDLALRCAEAGLYVCRATPLIANR